MFDMPKYRKKPVVIEAFQYTGEECFRNEDVPKWIIESFDIGILHWNLSPQIFSILYIETLEGKMRVSVGDYIIKGVRGELYACKPDIFIDTYEEVTE
jgi:hypothetical protein